MSQVGTVTESHKIGRKLCQDRRAVENLEALVRRRVRALYEKEGKSGDRWTAEKLAPFLGMKDPSGVRKLLNGDNAIGLAHIEGFCAAFQVTPCELVSPDGAPFTYLKETEPTLLRLFREMDAHERLSLINVLQWRLPTPPPRARKRARLGRAQLTEEQQLVVDLYARSEPQAREGVLKVLRGTARKTERAEPRTNGDRSE